MKKNSEYCEPEKSPNKCKRIEDGAQNAGQVDQSSKESLFEVSDTVFWMERMLSEYCYISVKTVKGL